MAELVFLGIARDALEAWAESPDWLERAGFATKQCHSEAEVLELLSRRVRATPTLVVVAAPLATDTLLEGLRKQPAVTLLLQAPRLEQTELAVGAGPADSTAPSMDPSSSIWRVCEAMTGRVAHDIRAPVSVILNAASELDHPIVGSLNEEQRALVRLVQRSAERLQNLSSNVSLAPNALSKTLKVSRVATSLHQLVLDAIGHVERFVDGRNIRVEPSSPERSASVDVGKLRLALVNLLANACQQARSSVVVRWLDAPHPGRLRIAIEDDGPGFSLEVLERFQGPASKTSEPPFERRSGGGIRGGFGLLIASAVVEAHEGCLTVRNGSRGGAIVEIELPAQGAA